MMLLDFQKVVSKEVVFSARRVEMLGLFGQRVQQGQGLIGGFVKMYYIPSHGMGIDKPF